MEVPIHKGHEPAFPQQVSFQSKSIKHKTIRLIETKNSSPQKTPASYDHVFAKRGHGEGCFSRPKLWAIINFPDKVANQTGTAAYPEKIGQLFCYRTHFRNVKDLTK